MHKQIRSRWLKGVVIGKIILHFKLSEEKKYMNIEWEQIAELDILSDYSFNKF